MNPTTSKHLTRGQLERTLSQQLQKLYYDSLDHATGRVSCRIFSDNLTVIVENALTQPEQILLQRKERTDLVEQIRSELDDVMRPGMIDLVEGILGKRVVDLMSDTTIQTGRTGIIFILSDG